MAQRKGKVWLPGQGWFAKQTTQEANYNNVGDGMAFLVSFIRWFPDFLLDLYHADDAEFDLTMLQRMILRTKARYQYCDITGCRGATKSFCSEGEEMVEALVWPGQSALYMGPSLTQTAKIGSDTFRQLEKNYPGFTKLFTVEAESKDRFELSTTYGSKFSIAAFRGNNVHKIVAEEAAQEEKPRFDDEEYRRIALPSVRLQYRYNGRTDPTYVRFKQHFITSAGRRQNHVYESRCRHFSMMERGESAFVMDIPYDAILLAQMRPVAWAEKNKMELTPDEWMREMESIYTGSDENPVVRDSVLSESRCLTCMEEHHCCKDRDNKLKPEDVFYIVGYDVSYADGAQNAKCACVVIKCTKQTDWLRRDRYMKQVVWVDDWPPMNAMEQAKKLKNIWNRFCVDGSMAYIAIDAWQYGSSVVQSLMMDLGDGLAPLCVLDHELYTEFEMDGAIPCIYPIKAGGVGTTDPDAEMVRNAELQFENRNVQLLTSNYQEGVEQYKRLHRIKDDRSDYIIYQPYKKTQELIGQIQNLKKVVTTTGVAERRISHHIQRDSWSALKYALRLAQKLERKYLMKQKKKSDWDELLKKFKSAGSETMMVGVPRGRIVGERRGGRRFV